MDIAENIYQDVKELPKLIVNDLSDLVRFVKKETTIQANYDHQQFLETLQKYISASKEEEFQKREQTLELAEQWMDKNYQKTFQRLATE